MPRYHRRHPGELPAGEFPEIALNRSADPEIALYLEKHGCRVWNDSYTARICNDKWQTHLLLQETGIPILPTFLATETTLDTLPDIPGVLKSRDGHGGTEVYLVNDPARRKEAFGKIGKPTAVFQRAATDLGKDACLRLGKNDCCRDVPAFETDFRSNFCLGGRADVTRSTRSSRSGRPNRRTFPFGLVGIDFIFDRGKPIFNEIEDVVGTRMLYTHTDIDIAGIYADFVLSRANRMRFPSIVLSPVPLATNHKGVIIPQPGSGAPPSDCKQRVGCLTATRKRL